MKNFFKGLSDGFSESYSGGFGILFSKAQKPQSIMKEQEETNDANEKSK